MIARLRPATGLREMLAALRPSRRDDVREFERLFAEKMGQRHAVAVPYGRTAQMLLLEAMGIRDKEVICPAYTCVVVAHAISVSGNEPVFVDSERGAFNMDLDLAAEAVTDRTAAIIATSLFGEPVDLEALDRFRARHPQVRVIQDCAHSFAADWNGQPVQQAGEAAIYGLNVSKIITSVFGGMVTTDSGELAARLRELVAARLTAPTHLQGVRAGLYLAAASAALSRPGFGVVHGMVRRGLLGRFVDYHDPEQIDMPGDHLRGMSAAQARVGIVQLGKYAAVVAHRREIAGIYARELDGCPEVVLPTANPGATWSHYTVRTSRSAQIAERLAAAGVELGRLVDYLVPDMPVYAGASFADRGIARAYVPEVLNLPVHMGVSPADARRIAALVAGSAASDSQTAGFDRHWETLTSDAPPPSKLSAARAFLGPLLRDPGVASARILDAGCGDGIHIAVLEDAAPRAAGGQRVGVDVSQAALCAAVLRGQGNWDVQKASVEQLPFPDGQFDAVYSYGVLGYVEHPQRGFEELCRVVRPGGLVGVWFYPRPDGLSGAVFRAVRATCRFVGAGGTRVIAFTIVPFLGVLPTASGVTLRNASLRQCIEVVEVNIAPQRLWFPSPSEIETWFAARGMQCESVTGHDPIALWGRLPG